jgi:hypothetical protein
MSQKITISSFTGNTPVDIYYCDSLSANCQYVASVELFPYIFYVEPPYDETDFLIKFVDSQLLERGDLIYITPTPTPSITPSATLTPTPTNTIGLTPTATVTPTLTQTLTPSNTRTQTPTQTPTLTTTPTNSPTVTITPSNTPTLTNTPTNTTTPTNTPTNTPTQTTTPVISVHLISRTSYIDSYDSCLDIMTTTSYYTYISEANFTPVIGAKVYESMSNGVLYSPFNGLDGYLKMKWGNDFYSVKIDQYGEIKDYVFCS